MDEPDYDVKDQNGRPLEPCGCLKRNLLPVCPADLAIEPLQENVPKLQEWLLDYYASSSLNTSPHQRLLLINSSPSLWLYIRTDVKPVAVHKADSIPVNMAEQVKADLERDLRLWVLDWMPENTPGTWCSRMHCVLKKDMSPTCTVDFSQVNKQCERQTHYLEPPLKKAVEVPETWRSTTNAWNGYPVIPIGKEDRHLTTFLTPWGRMRYDGW